MSAKNTKQVPKEIDPKEFKDLVKSFMMERARTILNKPDRVCNLAGKRLNSGGDNNFHNKTFVSTGTINKSPKFSLAHIDDFVITFCDIHGNFISVGAEYMGDEQEMQHSYPFIGYAKRNCKDLFNERIAAQNIGSSITDRILGVSPSGKRRPKYKVIFK